MPEVGGDVSHFGLQLIKNLLICCELFTVQNCQIPEVLKLFKKFVNLVPDINSILKILIYRSKVPIPEVGGDASHFGLQARPRPL